MLSRLGCLSRQFSAAPAQRLALQNVRALSTSSSLLNQGSTPPVPTTSTKERGPISKLLYDKTGVTGSWALGLGVAAFLISKEYYIVNSETVVCFIMGGTVLWLMKKIGPDVAAFLDEKRQGVLDLLNSGKNAQIEALKEAIENEKRSTASLASRDDIFGVLQENSEMRREEEYRRRLQLVTSEVKKRLDYHVEVEVAIRKHEQEQLIKWLTAQVIQAVKSKQVQEESLAQCMKELKRMSAATA